MPARLTPAPAGVIARYILLGAGLGLLAGIAWSLLAPRVMVTALADGDFVEQFPQEFIASDLILGSLLLLAGLVIGVVAAVRLHRTGFRSGWTQVAGAVAAALTAAAVARVVGWWLAGRTPSSDGTGTFGVPITLQATGVLLLAAFAALLVVVLYSAFAREPVTPEAEPSGPS